MTLTYLNHTSTDSHGNGTVGLTSHRTLHDYSNNNRMRIFNLLNFKEMPDKFQPVMEENNLTAALFTGKTKWPVGNYSVICCKSNEK